MSIETKQDCKTAKIATLVFFLLCVPLSYLSLVYISRKIFVSGNVAATAANLLMNSELLKVGTLLHILSTIAFFWMAVLFYRLLASVSKHMAAVMLTFAIIQIPIVFVLELFRTFAQLVIKDNAVLALDLSTRENLAYLFLRVHGYGISGSEVFWGGYFIFFGLLLYKAHFLPNFFSTLIIMGGVSKVIETLIFSLTSRGTYIQLVPYIKMVFVGVIVSLLWLLIKGGSIKEKALNN